MNSVKRPVRTCPRLPNNVLRGEWAEAAFLSRALALGSIVCRPFCDTRRFDFLLISATGKVFRVQVKSAWGKRCDRGYRLNLGHHGGRYRSRDLDFIAGYVAPEDAWYIIPIRQLKTGHAKVFPHIPHSRSHWERYREAWHLLQP